MQTLTIKLNDNRHLKFLIELLSKFTFIEEIKTTKATIKNKEKDLDIPIRQATGTPLIDDFAGLWEQNPKTFDQIREKAWTRNM